MTPAEFAQRLVDNVAAATQLDPDKGELPNVDDWRRNAEALFATCFPPPPPTRACVCGALESAHPRRKCEGYHPAGGRTCPGCYLATYRPDGIAWCTDCESAKGPR